MYTVKTKIQNWQKLSVKLNQMLAKLPKWLTLLTVQS